MREEAKASGKLWNQPFGLYRLTVQTALSVTCPELHFWRGDAPCEVTQQPGALVAKLSVQ